MAMPSVPDSEYQNRVAKARALMRDNNLTAIITTDSINYYYFSGQKISPSRSRPSIFLLPVEKDPILITWEMEKMFSSLEGRKFPSWVSDTRFYPEVPFSNEEFNDWGISKALNDREIRRGKIGIEIGANTRLGIPLGDFMSIRKSFPEVEFVDSGKITWPCRMIKSKWELETIRKCCDIGGKAWERCFQELRVGFSPRDIKLILYENYVKLGADLNSTGGFAKGTTGKNDTFQTGDVLYLDGGCSYFGYEMDITRRAVFGHPDERQIKEHKMALQLLQDLICEMKPGVSVSSLFEHSNERVKKMGLLNYSTDPAKRIGHGIGLEPEPPSINAIDQSMLEEGMVLTPEPKFISKDGLVNPEEQIVVTNDGYELLSTSPDPGLRIVD